jgi:superfamily II DNA or RNA helicase
VQLIFDEVALLIINSTESLESKLCFVESRMGEKEDEEDGAEDLCETEAPKKKAFKGLEVIRETVEMFVVKNAVPRVIQTHQGFLNRVTELCQKLGYSYSVHDDRMPFPRPDLTRMSGFRGSQGRLTTQLLCAPTSGCLRAPTRFGKCFGPDTLIRTEQGAVRARDIRVGDKLKTPSGGFTTVVAVTTGRDVMLRVKPLDRPDQSWFCTSDHPLCLRYRNKDILMAAEEALRLLESSTDFRASAQMRSAAFANTEATFSGPVREECDTWLDKREIPIKRLVGLTAGEAAYRLQRLRACNEIRLKHIMRSPVFMQGVQELLWLCGDRSTTPEFYLHSGSYAASNINFVFDLDHAGMGEFVGWQVDSQEQEFLLADLTVVHNTTIITNICRAFPGLPTVITLPGRDLVTQLADDLRYGLPEREIKVISSASTKKVASSDITVCSVDSLHHCDEGETRLLIIDEPHAAVTDPRSESIMKFEKARRYAIGATLGMRFDKRDPLIEGLFGPVHASISFTEAVAEKSICQIEAIMLVVRMSNFPRYLVRNAAYDFFLFKSERMADIHAFINREVIPQDWQTLSFIKHEKQARLLQERLNDPNSIIAMAKLMPQKKVREAVFERLRTGEVKRCMCSSIYAQGVTFPDVRVVINMAGGGPYQSSVQKPGRLAQNRPGKRCGVLIDFLFVPDTADCMNADPTQYYGKMSANRCLSIDSQKRLQTYRDTGYSVNFVQTPAELKAVFQQKCL